MWVDLNRPVYVCVILSRYIACLVYIDAGGGDGGGCFASLSGVVIMTMIVCTVAREGWMIKVYLDLYRQSPVALFAVIKTSCFNAPVLTCMTETVFL